jgi:hypothetical protein
MEVLNWMANHPILTVIILIIVFGSIFPIKIHVKGDDDETK